MAIPRVTVWAIKSKLIGLNDKWYNFGNWKSRATTYRKTGWNKILTQDPPYPLRDFPDGREFLHSVKSADIPAIGTLIWASHEKLTPDPPYCLKNKGWIRPLSKLCIPLNKSSHKLHAQVVILRWQYQFFIFLHMIISLTFLHISNIIVFELHTYTNMSIKEE